ncbi:hypothetical protein LTS18_002134 [Coniosporium uncinatum]|uniref:Uncharacterized protein n=1 Tax=Coniosporium uncinatum TaxID=93489 RepID=A0ACC3DUV3_9PEZI|nr:hypothetical protein LTS18_002134 [Coniosporium uncinatum]
MVMHAGGTEAISNMPAMPVPVAIGMLDMDVVMDWAVVAPMAARKKMDQPKSEGLHRE